MQTRFLARLHAQAFPLGSPCLENRLEQLGRGIEGVDGRIDAVLARLEAAEQRIVAHIDERLATAAPPREEDATRAAPAGAAGAEDRDKEGREYDDRRRLKACPHAPLRRTVSHILDSDFPLFLYLCGD